MALDFSKMQYDISKEGLLTEHYPFLAEIREFDHPEKDQLLRLAIAISDEESPFVKHKVYDKIVIDACEYLKIMDDFMIKALLHGLYHGDAEDVRYFVFLLFTTNNNWAYQTWYNMMYSYHETSLVIRTPLNVNDDKYENKAAQKQKMIASLPELQKSLANYESQIFPNTFVKKIVTQRTALITNWPEKMAKIKPVLGNGDEDWE